MGPLQECHVETLCRLWPHFAECYRPMMHTIVAHNASAGVFVEGQLVSMALEGEHGGVGVVQTDPQYRGKGYAGLAIAFLLRQMGTRGINVFTTVRDDNHPSLRMMDKAGFGDSTNVIHFFFYM